MKNMIKTFKYQTKHIITALNNYALDCDDKEYLKYQYGYLKVDDFVIDKIVEFKNNWENGIERQEKQFFELLEPITLIESEHIIDGSQSNDKGFEFIKLDSISFLENEPNLSELVTYTIKGGITCYKDFFTIDTERIPDGQYMPSIIYRSPRYLYSKVFDKLKDCSHE